MSRSVSSTLKAAVFSQETSEIFLILLKIAHTDITTLRLVNNYENVTSTADGGSQTYIAYPFSIHLPHDIGDQLPSVTIKIDNVSRSIIDEIRTLTGSPDVTMWVVLNSAPNTVEAGPFEMKLRNVVYDAFTITGELEVEDILNEPYPGIINTPQNRPGLF